MAAVCKTCGGPMQRVGNYYICEYCRNKWEIDSGNDVHAVERANAWAALRDGDFEKATELFENIIAKENQNHEAYWGRALALGGIVYVNDLSENKKVPTCNNITEQSFIQNKDVQKAISLAPADIAGSYRQQAEYIEKVRTEWLEKASKEPAYDVFISFKDSDRENGIERTQDSIDAQDLYNALVAEGYKVFFSRISLRDKISEQYEPYIYNAIKTAKVMIVFGEKAEYFSSVWIKNEWMRFKSRIEKGEKHKNSLVAVYKNMNPGDLPAALRSRQCLNAADMTFLSDLNRHIKRIVDETKKSVHLDKIEIIGGQIAKKATTLAVNAVQTREIGAGAIAETSISEKQSISLIRTYLEEKQWSTAQQLVDDLLFENPGCAEAIWCGLLAKYHATDDAELLGELDLFQTEDYSGIDKMLNCASKEFAEEKLLFLYRAEKNTSDKIYCQLLNIILPYNFSKRQSQIDAAFKAVIESGKFYSFKALLNTLKSSAVNKYISYNCQYAISVKQLKGEDRLSERAECLQSIIKVDAGNVDALRELVFVDLGLNRAAFIVAKGFEEVLRYSSEQNQEVLTCLQWLGENLMYSENCHFAKQLLRYYSGELSTLRDHIKALGYRMLACSLFKEAEYFFSLMLTINQNDPDAYWGICLMKAGICSEDGIKDGDGDIPLQSIPEFNKYLTLVDKARRNECMWLLRIQKLASCRRRTEFANKLFGGEHTFMDAVNHKIISIEYDHIEKNLSSYRLKRIFGTHSVLGDFAFLTWDNSLYSYQSGKTKRILLKRNMEIVDRCHIGINEEVVWLYSDGVLEFPSDRAERKYKDELVVKNGKILRHDRYWDRVTCARDDIVEACGGYGLNIDGTIEKKKDMSVIRREIMDGTFEKKKGEKGEIVPGIENAVHVFFFRSGYTTSYYSFALLADGTVKLIDEGGDFSSFEYSYVIEPMEALKDIVAVRTFWSPSVSEVNCIKSDGSIVYLRPDGAGSLKTYTSPKKCFTNLDAMIKRDRSAAQQECEKSVWDEQRTMDENRKAVADAITQAAIKDKRYNACRKILSGEIPSSRENWFAAQTGFESISGWRDADALALHCAEQVRACDEQERIAAERRAERERVAAEQRAARERIAAEQRAERERIAAEKRAEEERIAAEKRAEKERIAAEKRAKLQKEEAALQAELANLKGLFTGKRRKQIEARLAELVTEIAQNDD